MLDSFPLGVVGVVPYTVSIREPVSPYGDFGGPDGGGHRARAAADWAPRRGFAGLNELSAAGSERLAGAYRLEPHEDSTNGLL